MTNVSQPVTPKDDDACSTEDDQLETQSNQYCDSSDDEDDDECTSSCSSASIRRNSSASLKIRAQKHLVGRMVCTKKSIRPLIGRRASNALESLEQLLKLHIQPASQVKPIIRAAIKTIAKIGLVVKQKTLSSEQLQFAQVVKKQMRTISLTVISFARTEFTYDRGFLDHALLDCQQTLKRCVIEVLSAKSHERIDFVFNALRDAKLLDSIFSSQATPQQKQALTRLTEHLESLVSLSSQP
ncbi:hypothetical protein AHF37_09431 [Paragonimus kellicotti]|nr:hypothetical protein AHF37_09431 [Paragonimus kellicotti]